MGDFTMKLEGLKEIDKKLAGLKGPVAKRLIRDAVMAGGKVMQDEVRLRTPARPELPHGSAIPPGALKSDIELHFGITEEGLPAAIVKPGKYTAHVARWLEYGHRLVRGGYSKLLSSGRTRGKGHEVGAVRPYPFIRPAFESSRIPAMETTIATFEKELPEAIRTGSLPGSGSDGGAVSSNLSYTTSEEESNG